MSNPKGVANFKRRTWDREEYAKKAREAASSSSTDGPKATVAGAKASSDIATFESVGSDGRTRNMLDSDGRKAKLNLDVRVGTSRAAAGANDAGFECSLCDMVYKDSNSYLAHINSAQHLAKQGLSLSVKKSTAAEVAAKLSSCMDSTVANVSSVEEYKVAENDNFESSDDEKPPPKRRRKRKKRDVQVVVENDEMASALGFGAF